MNRIIASKSGLPITLMEAIAIDDGGNKLFAVPKIFVFRSKEKVVIGTIGSHDVKTFNIDSQVQGYIPSVYGDQAYELDRCVQKLHKEINIIGNLKNKFCGNLTGVLIDSYRFLNDEKCPHTGWIKIIAKSYKVEPVIHNFRSFQFL